MSVLTIALAQIDLALGQPQENLRSARAAMRAARERGADVVVLPELWSTGYDLEHAAEHASALDAGMFVHMAQAAHENEIAVVGSLLEAEGGRVYNTATFVDASGRRLGAYRKLHLVPMLEEDRYLVGGEDAPVFDTPFGRCALAVCYDLRFPELWRHYALDGARLIFLPAEWPAQRVTHWLALLPARAIENQVFVAAVNRVGIAKGEKFGGRSMIVDPWGVVLAQGNGGPSLVVAQIDLDEVEKARERMPALRDRRPEVYGRW